MTSEPKLSQQTVLVEQDRHDPNRIMITVRESYGSAATVRVEKVLLPQLIADLGNQLPDESLVVDEPDEDYG